MWRGRVLEYALRQHPEYLQVRGDMPALEGRQSPRQPYDVSVAAWLGLIGGRTARCEESLSEVVYDESFVWLDGWLGVLQEVEFVSEFAELLIRVHDDKNFRGLCDRYDHRA